MESRCVTPKSPNSTPEFLTLISPFPMLVCVGQPLRHNLDVSHHVTSFPFRFAICGDVVPSSTIHTVQSARHITYKPPPGTCLVNFWADQAWKIRIPPSCSWTKTSARKTPSSPFTTAMVVRSFPSMTCRSVHPPPNSPALQFFFILNENRSDRCQVCGQQRLQAPGRRTGICGG